MLQHNAIKNEIVPSSELEENGRLSIAHHRGHRGIRPSPIAVQRFILHHQN